jgi:hypothetical protein
MNIFKFVFGKHETQIPKVETIEPKVDFDSKLYDIIDAFGEEIYQGDLKLFQYEYKSIKILRRNCYYIDINDVNVYTSYGNRDDKDHWRNDIIAPKCKLQIMDLVDKLYVKAIIKIETDKINALTSDKLKVKQGCMELYD